MSQVTPTNIAPWAVTQLERDLPRRLADATTDHERIMVRTLHGSEVRRLAARIHIRAELLGGRPLTPGERAIAVQYGWFTNCAECRLLRDWYRPAE